MTKNNQETNKQLANVFPVLEESVLGFWEKAKIFEKSVDRKAARGDYVFYDGPPFATGLPHYGHIVASIIKDSVPRYWTMKGFRVERRWGWDCHGLPIENIVEKELGSKSKKDIEATGVAKFNELCRSKVLEYAEDWKKYIKKLGRWVDMENGYRTMDLNFMESVWWVFKELWNKGLVYKDYRSMHVCPRCETTLSQSEVAEGYKDVKDLSCVVKFKLKYRAGKTGRGVGAIIVNDKNEVLLIKRNEKNRRVTWALPGGKVEGKESFREALDREVKEELGVEVESARPVTGMPDIMEGRLFETICYETKIKGEPKVMLPDEHEEVKWFSLDNLPEIDYPPSRNALKIYKSGQNKFFITESTDRPLTDVYILAWTTTPWTLIGNVALAIGHDIAYVMVKMGDEYMILAKDRLEDVIKDKEHEIVAGIKSDDLKSLEYESLFDYYSSDEKLENRQNGLPAGQAGWKIYAGDFVTTDEGTGVVHIAPAFGEDDMKLGRENNLPFVQHVAMDGYFKEEVKDFLGMNVKPKDDVMATDVAIIKYLAHNNLLFSKAKYEHSYPHCWRCDTPLLNYATSSWFVKVAEIKEPLLKNAEKINWSPEHIKAGRFGKWLEGARDWSISRQRYWASVIPIWECECGEKIVIGSISELEKLSGQKVNDLHKHIVDEITIKCAKCGGTMKRIPDVFDCWFESGSMPYAQMHYPFDNKEKFENNFPAEFIAEGADQTRAWFYYLHVLATGVKETEAFKNVIVNGIVLAEDGKKMSKKLKNYPDPMEIFDKYGADALRYYLLTSPVMLADTLCFSEKGVKEALQKVNMLLWNVVKFYGMYQGERSEVGSKKSESDNILDKWIMARLDQLIEEVTENMDKYNLPKATRPIMDFIDDLSTWYLRRSRDRFKGEDEADKQAALATTGYVLTELSKVIAPFTPFLAEQVWQAVTGNDFKDENKSVHLEIWPSFAKATEGKPEKVLEEMIIVRKIVELGLAKRDEAGIKIRQPLSELRITNYELQIEYEGLIKDELNVKNIIAVKEDGELSVELNTEITEELKQEGIKRELVRAINNMRKDAGLTIADRVTIKWKAGYAVAAVIEKYKDDLMKDTLADEIMAADDIEGGKEVKIDGETIKIKMQKLEN
ncbi:MAG: isoleucine--tRNA ligase [Candidatus Falkowbacteria bacterium]